MGDQKRDFYYWIGAIAIAAGFVLSIVSILKLCSQECAEGHNYRLLGVPLDPVGILFFGGLGVVHYLLPKYPQLKSWAGIAISGGLGMEIVFIYLQKAVIGHWCPVCLSIAAALTVLAITYALPSVLQIYQNRSQKMDLLKYAFSYSTVAVIGFVVAFTGMTKIDPLEAAETSIKDSIVFGDPKNEIEVYVFTDWQCPACRKVEPALEKMTSSVSKKAKLIFVDFTVHAESLNFTPYNLSFMVNNKDQYWELRHALTDLSQKTKTPTDEQVEKIASKVGVSYKQLNYADTALGLKYFKQLGKQFKIQGTPTVVIVNREDKKGKKLAGTAEITEANVLEAIDKLKE